MPIQNVDSISAEFGGSDHSTVSHPYTYTPISVNIFAKRREVYLHVWGLW